ncbi:MAG: ABC transporter ATP-binding protein [archaeon]
MDIKYNLRVYGQLLKRYRWLIAIMILLIIILEASYVADRLIFKYVIDKITAFAEGALGKDLLIAALLFLAGIYLIIFLVRVVLRWTNMHCINRLETRLIFDLKQKFFNHLINLSYSFHTSNKTGSIISRLVRGGSAIERMTDVFVFNLLPFLVQLIVIGGSLLVLDPLSALVMTLTAIVFIIFNYLTMKTQLKAYTAMNNQEDYEKAQISDFFTNVESIMYFGKQKDVMGKYQNVSTETKKATLHAWNHWRFISAGQVFILGIGTLILVYTSINSFLANRITIGTLVFTYATFTSFTGVLYSFVHGMRDYNRAIADFESLFQYGKVQQEITDSPGARQLLVNEGTITFQNVTFKHKGRKILDRFSLRIPKNKKVAIIGPSGAGKTTIIKLLYRFYDPAEGTIRIDDKNIKDVTQESLRSELSIVPQECVLFDDTILNNIAFSSPAASREEVDRAMRFAQLDKIIEQFPNKDQTIVGERGIKLSGGEKQRVSIARALLANKKILILDEATSSLDSSTEHDIQRDLFKLMQHRTSIIIAHRLSTIMHADIIVVINNGRIVQQGTHKQLIKKKGLYKTLWELQKGGYYDMDNLSDM